MTARVGELAAVHTPRIPVTTSYHGVDVIDDYRWLEDAGSDDTVVWTKAQQQRTREHLDAVPWRATLRARVEGLMRAERTSYTLLTRGGALCFALKEQPPKQQRFLVALSDLDDRSGERVVVDPNEIDPSGATTIDFFVPSPDGGRVAVSLSENGTEDGTLHVYDAASGELVDEPIPHVNLMGGSVAWRGDGTGFWYTLCADPGGFHQQVWFRDLTTGEDRADLTDGFAEPRIAENYLSGSPDGRWLMDRVQRGDGGEWQVFVRNQDGGDWWQVADIADKCIFAVLGDGVLYLLSRDGTPRGTVLRLPLRQGATVADAEEVVATGDATIDDLAVTDGTLWVFDIDGGPGRVRAFGLDGTPLPAVDIPPISSVSSYFSRVARAGRDAVAWSGESFTTPATWWLAVDGCEPRPTALGTSTPVDLSGYQVTRQMATSKDGTKVPFNVIAAPGTPRDGSAPALLVAYGGYGISLGPRFQGQALPWLEQGGVLVVANIRGGGEYGEEWHHAGRLTNKQNCFDDFIACADHLVSSGITSRERLAINGGSNGGLLMGAALTQRPDLARVVVAEVPVMDSLRAETTPNGTFNVTEYGTVEDPDQCSALLAYSPYHNVVDGTAYPAVLLTAGEFDSRVDAWHAKKMTARLQEATSSDEPVLLRMESGGHGLGSSLEQEIDLLTDYYCFLFDRLGLGYRATGGR